MDGGNLWTVAYWINSNYSKKKKNNQEKYFHSRNGQGRVTLSRITEKFPALTAERLKKFQK